MAYYDRPAVAASVTEFLIACMAAGVIVRVLATPVFGTLAVDVPNDRSLHATLTPRTGGLGLLAGAVAACAFSPVAGFSLVAWLTATLAVTFFIDDVRGLLPQLRITVQAVVAIVFVIWGTWALDQSPLLSCLLILGMIWCMNAYNFMDGTNGLAGGMAVIGFGAYAVAAHSTGAADLAASAAVVSGAALGFLIWNFDPARIFLGDAGSITLGFLATALGILGWQRGVWPFWFPPLVFSPFILDATVTLLTTNVAGRGCVARPQVPLLPASRAHGLESSQVVIGRVRVDGSRRGLGVGYARCAAPERYCVIIRMGRGICSHCRAD